MAMQLFWPNPASRRRSILALPAMVLRLFAKNMKIQPANFSGIKWLYLVSLFKERDTRYNHKVVPKSGNNTTQIQDTTCRGGKYDSKKEQRQMLPARTHLPWFRSIFKFGVLLPYCCSLAAGVTGENLCRIG